MESLAHEVDCVKKELKGVQEEYSSVKSNLQRVVEDLKDDLEDLIETNDSSHEIKNNTFTKMLSKLMK